MGSVLRLDVSKNKVSATPAWPFGGACRSLAPDLTEAQIAKADAAARVLLGAEPGQLARTGTARSLVYRRADTTGRTVI